MAEILSKPNWMADGDFGLLKEIFELDSLKELYDEYNEVFNYYDDFYNKYLNFF